MEFEWDGAKSDQNLRRRGIGFDYSASVFDGPTFEIIDDRRAYGEIRIRAIGQIDENVIVVVYTDDRGEIRRIISARKANRRARQLWQSFANP